jgi:hypothetical protein
MTRNLRCGSLIGVLMLGGPDPIQWTVSVLIAVRSRKHRRHVVEGYQLVTVAPPVG